MNLWEMSSLQIVYVGDDDDFAFQSEQDLKLHGCTQPLLRLKSVDEITASLPAFESKSKPSILVLEGSQSVSTDVDFLSWLNQRFCHPNIAAYLLTLPAETSSSWGGRQLRKTREWIRNLEEFVIARNHKAFDERMPKPDGVMGQLALMSAFSAEAVVLTDSEGRTEWVNDSFEKMCGYSFQELRGKKPGSVLQGFGTSPACVSLLRESVRESRPCECDILNYTKDKKPYTVHLSLGPVVEEDQLKGFIALETLIAPASAPKNAR